MGERPEMGEPPEMIEVEHEHGTEIPENRPHP